MSSNEIAFSLDSYAERANFGHLSYVSYIKLESNFFSVSVSNNVFSYYAAVPSNCLYSFTASSSVSVPTTTAEPRFMKLIEMSFVRIDNPRSP